MSLMRATLLLGTCFLTVPVLAAGPDQGSPAPLALGKPAAAQPARPQPGLGQPFKLQREKPAAAVAAQPPAKAAIDESALRYYASTGDSARVAAEIARLRALYPEWSPPEDLFISTVTVDEQPVWDLFGAGRFEDAKATIEQLQAENPGYSPSSDLKRKLDRAIARTELVAASDGSDWERVLQIAEETDGLLVCREMDVLWRVAKAFAETGDQDQSVGVYRYIIGNCDDPKERLATVQKASLHLGPAEVEQLIALGKRRQDGRGEFEPVRLDFVRRAVGSFAAGQSAEPPSDKDVKLLEAQARGKNGAADAQLLGWYHYARKNYEVALDFFKLSAAQKPDPKSIEGQILALRNLNRTTEALALARANLALAPDIRKAFIDAASAEVSGPNAAALDPAIVQQLAATVPTERSALGAQSLGWYYFNRRADAEAKVSFARSLEYGPSAEGALGLALTAHRLGDLETARKVARDYASYPQLAALTWLEGKPAAKSTVTRRASKETGSGKGKQGEGGGGLSAAEREAYALHDAGKYAEARAVLDGLAAKGQQSYGTEVVRAWAHYNAGSYDTARQIFTKLDKVKSTRDTRYGGFLSDNAYYGRKIW
jgi:tetratricopeptide (TPR) repeat protein